MERLKPCPFCGGEAAVRTSTTHTIPNHANALCYCKECLSTGPIFADYDNDGSFIIKAVNAWNRRANDVLDSKPMTNGDRIRSMTDEELADYLRYHSDSYARYDMDWLDWLKQETE